jgi:predicted CXXCH cytochrome family protein
MDCHEADYAQWMAGPHGPDRANVPCERCHGSGKEHVDDPYNLLKIINLRSIPVSTEEWKKSYISIESQSGFCAKCHMEKYIELKSASSMNRVTSCPVCHMPHGTENPATTVRPGDKLCTRCHSLVPGNILSLSTIHNINTTGYRFPEHEAVELKCIDCHMPAASEEKSHRMLFAISGCIACHSDKDKAWAMSKIPEWERLSTEKVMHPVEPSLVGEIKSTSELREELYTTWHYREISELGSSAGLVALLIIFSIPLILWMRKEGML